MKKKVNFKGTEYIVELLKNGNIEIDGKVFSSSVSQRIENIYKVDINGHPFTVEIAGDKILVDGEISSLSVKPHIEKKSITDINHYKKEVKIKAPIPGKINKVLIKEGESVKKNQELIILEAMKMRNRIFSPFRGKILRVFVKEDENVNQDQTLLEVIRR
ncbi:MAG: biotin/lipoyl-containing protein [Candidatus Thorarchaeota archaeon]